MSGTPGEGESPPDGKTRYYKVPRRRRRWPWAAFYTVWIVIAVVVAAAWGIDRAAQHLLDQISPNNSTVVAARKALAVDNGPDTTFLILGSDNRSWIAGSENLADSMILVRLAPSQNLISIMSVPRDLAVILPGYANLGTVKINEAYELGGPEEAIQTVEEYLHVPVNHYVDVGFEGFFEVIQHLGGLYTQVDRRYYNAAGDGYAPIDLYPGYQRLNGNQALAFARFRHTDTDIVRAARQQQILLDLKRQVSANFGLTDVPVLLNAVADGIQTDVHSLSTLINIGQFLLGLPHGRIYHTTLQVSFSNTAAGDYDLASPAQIATSVNEFLDPLATQQAKALPATITVPTHTSHAATHVTAAQAKAAARAAAVEANTIPSELSVTSAPAQALIGLGPVGLPLLVPSLQYNDAQLDTAMPVRAYRIEGGPDGGWPSVVEVFANQSAAGSYYDVQETRMTSPPVMQDPTSVIHQGTRTYDLFQDGSVLRYVGFWQDKTWYWVSNTFDGALSPAQILGIAASLQPATKAIHAPAGVGALTRSLDS